MSNINFLVKPNRLILDLRLLTFLFSIFTHVHAIEFGDIPEIKDEEKRKPRMFLDQKLSDFKDKRSLMEKSGEEFDLDMPYITDFPLDENEYIIGPGDLFEVHIEDERFTYEVNPEGNVVFENIGIVPVADSTLAGAKNVLLRKIKAVNKNMNCYVNLKRSKTMLVFVTGAVGLPGIHRTRGNIRASDIIVQAKWFRPDAQKGIAIITSKDSMVKKIDLSHFLREGSLDENPYIKQGDIIHVPFIDYSMPYVTVRRSNTMADVQLKQGETLENLLTRFEGYQAYNPPHSVVVKEPSKPEKVIQRSQLNSYTPENHAFIDVSENIENVFVGGAVQKPGFLPYNKGNTALNYIGQSGLKADSKVNKKVKLVRKDGSTEKISLTSKDIHPGDALIVKENFEKKVLLYTPILISIGSLSLAIVTLMMQR